MNYGKALRESRKKAGLTQFELAEITGFSRSYLSYVENGKIPSKVFMMVMQKEFEKKNVPEQGQYSRPDNALVCPHCGIKLSMKLVLKSGG